MSTGRIRSIKPELLIDEEASALPDHAWRFFVSTWLLADDHGNLRAGTKFLATNIYQDSSRTADVSAALQVLTKTKRPGGQAFVLLYEVGGQVYAHLPGFLKHQRITHPSGPKVPRPCDGRLLKSHEAPRSGRPSSINSDTCAQSLTGSSEPSQKILPRACALDREREVDRDQDQEQERDQERDLYLDPPADLEGSQGRDHTAPPLEKNPDPWGLAPDGQDPDSPTSEAKPPPTPRSPVGTFANADPNTDPTSADVAPQGALGSNPAPTGAPTQAQPQDDPVPAKRGAKAKGGKTRQKPAPPPPAEQRVIQLSQGEQAAANAIRRDPDLSRICKNIEQLAVDLVACAPLVDVALEIVALGAWLRTPRGQAKRYTDGNSFLLNNIRKKQSEQSERQRDMPTYVASHPQARRMPQAPPVPRDVDAAIVPGEKPGQVVSLSSWKTRTPLVTDAERDAEERRG